MIRTLITLLKCVCFGLLACPAVYGQAARPEIPNKNPELVIDAVWAATAITDMGLTQRCIRSGQCREGNPTLPSNTAGMFAVGDGETALSMWAFHRFRVAHPRLAVLIPAVNIAAHGVGIWSYARSH